MTHPRFFGYGSLVNTTTHDYPDTEPARLTGWRRVWRHTTLRPAAFLSVEPQVNSAIEGLTAAVPNADWKALDDREYAYRRSDITHQIDPSSAPRETAVYRVDPAFHAADGTDHPILLSYLDVVVQGFDTVFGEAGVERFFETTDGWDTPVLDDRSAPVYPRHRVLKPRQTELVDHWVDRLSLRVRKA